MVFAHRPGAKFACPFPCSNKSPNGASMASRRLVNTLAHEMIHQWQYDILKRRPNHGADFLRKMTEMNRDGALAITIYHSLQKEVLALTRFAWRCRQCGRVYRRQRRTIQPRRHHCGICRGVVTGIGGSVSRVPTDSEVLPTRQRLPLNAPCTSAIVLYLLAGCWKSPPAAFSLRSEAQRTEAYLRLFARCGLAERLF